MNKRFIAMALVALLTLATLPAVAMDGGEGSTWHAYVYTSNGKGLNLRPEPSTSRKPITTIPYGAMVHLNEYINQGWVEIDYGDYHGYVMGRYLTYEKPAPKPKPAPEPAPESQSSFKAVFKGFALTNYIAQVRPSTPGGFVHMRWAPTKAADPIRDYHQFDQLTVIAENTTWAQVVDPGTGITGFMMRSFLTTMGVDGASGVDSSGS